ncbi:MAG: hypothetical protein V8K32_12975 [Candidatus Electrothrix gigas]
MKEQKNTTSFEKRLNNTKEKKSYEKPQLSTVTLFADQVMGNCNIPGQTSICNNYNKS